MPYDESCSFDRASRLRRSDDQGARKDTFSLHAVYQPHASPQRPSVAEPFLFVPAGKGAFLEDSAVHRAESAKGGNGKIGGKVQMVQRKGSSVRRGPVGPAEYELVAAGFGTHRLGKGPAKPGA